MEKGFQGLRDMPWQAKSKAKAWEVGSVVKGLLAYSHRFKDLAATAPTGQELYIVSSTVLNT